RSVAGITAVNCVGETYVVARSAPFHRTTEVLTKFVPVTVSVNCDPPAVADGGLRLVVVGIGLRIVKVCGFDAAPPGGGVDRVTCAVPAAAMSAGAIPTVSCVGET